jgi:hypothetical protein
MNGWHEISWDKGSVQAGPGRKSIAGNLLYQFAQKKIGVTRD